jgi:hypothetical protein
MPFALSPLIFRYDLSRQPSVGSHVETLLLCPGPNQPAALPTGRGPDLGPAAATVHPPRVLDKGRQPAPKVGRMLGAQIELVRRAFQCELNRLVGRAAGQIVLQLYLKPLHRLPPEERMAGANLQPPASRVHTPAAAVPLLAARPPLAGSEAAGST